MRRFLLTLMLGAALAAPPLGGTLLAADPAPLVNETFDRPGGGEFQNLLKIAPGESWSGEVSGGDFVLTNTTEAGAIKYFSINGLKNQPPGTLESATVAVDVTGTSEGADSGSGLIWGLDPKSRTYLLFVLLGTGEYAVLVRNQDGIQPLAKGESDLIHADAPNRLAIRPGVGEVELQINGRRLIGFKVQGQLGPGTGIAAFGKGTFRFDNFSLTPAVG